MKKLLIIVLVSVVSIALISTAANANMFNRFKKGFYFEKYKTADEAKDALLDMHPIGSDVSELIKTLERAGGGCGIFETKIEDYVDKFKGKEFTSKRQVTLKKNIITSFKDHVICYYQIKMFGGFLGNYDWTVVAYPNRNDVDKIGYIGVSKFYNFI